MERATSWQGVVHGRRTRKVLCCRAPTFPPPASPTGAPGLPPPARGLPTPVPGAGLRWTQHPDASTRSDAASRSRWPAPPAPPARHRRVRGRGAGPVRDLGGRTAIRPAAPRRGGARIHRRRRGGRPTFDGRASLGCCVGHASAVGGPTSRCPQRWAGASRTSCSTPSPWWSRSTVGVARLAGGVRARPPPAERAGAFRLPGAAVHGHDDHRRTRRGDRGDPGPATTASRPLIGTLSGFVGRTLLC